MVLLPIGHELVKALSNFELKQYSIFKDYFQSCVLLAGNKTHRGHLHSKKIKHKMIWVLWMHPKR